MSVINGNSAFTYGTTGAVTCGSYYGPNNSNYSDDGCVGYRIMVNATNLKQIKVAGLSRMLYRGTYSYCDDNPWGAYSGCTERSSNSNVYKYVCVTISSSGDPTNTSATVFKQYTVSIRTNSDSPIQSNTYTLSSPYSGTLYVFYTIPNFGYSLYTYCMVGVKQPSNSDFTLTDASPLELTSSIDNISTYSGTNYINLSSTSNKITGWYKITSDYPNSNSYISVGGTTKISSLTYGSKTLFECTNISPVKWSSQQEIKIYAKNTNNESGTTTESVRLYGAPVGHNRSSTPMYRMNSSNPTLYYAFDNFGPNQTGLSVSCNIGTATIDSSSSDGQVNILYTPDTTACGDYTATITLTDNFTGTPLTATSTFSYGVYEPPNVSFAPYPYTPSLNETVTFTNTSTSESGGSYEYFWYINGALYYTQTVQYTFTGYTPQEIRLIGCDTRKSDDEAIVSHTYTVPSYVPDVEFNSIGPVYATIPATSSIIIDPTKEGIAYTWYFKASSAYEYVKIQDGGSSCTFTPQITTDSGAYIKVTAEKDGELKYGVQAFIVDKPTPTMQFSCYTDAEGTQEITSSTPVADSSTKVYLRNDSVPVATTSPTYKWYFNGSEITPISTLNDLPYFIPSVSSTGLFELKLEGVVGEYNDYIAKNLTIVSPAPHINSIVTSQPSGSYGDTIYCSLDLTEVVTGATYSYSWTLDGQPIGTSSDSSISFVIDTQSIKTYTITAKVSVVGSHTTWNSNTATTTVNSVEYKDPMKRYTLVIKNSINAKLCTRDSMSQNRYNSLVFEKRLNETGSGSFNLLIDSSSSDEVIASGSDIIIYDNACPIYYGVITDVNNNNISPFGASLSKKYYSINFAEGCRKLSYTMCSNYNEYTAPYSSPTSTDNLLYYIAGSDYIGSVDDFENKYTMSVSYQDMLSQIDSLSEQCGARYRTNIHEYCNYNDAVYSSIQLGTITISRVGGWPNTIQSGSLVFFRNSNCVCFGKVVSVSGVSLNFDYMAFGGNITPGDEISISVIKPNPVIDFRQKYYSTLGPSLIINKTTYNVDDVDSLNKHYGKIACVSPQNGYPNITLSFKLIKSQTPAGEFSQCAYVYDTGFCEIVEANINETNNNYLDIVVSRAVSGSEDSTLYIPFKYDNNDDYSYINILSPQGSSVTRNYPYTKNGRKYVGTKYYMGVGLPGGLTNKNNYLSIIGTPVFCTKVKCIDSGLTPISFDTVHKLQIGGYEFTPSSVLSISSGKWELTLPTPIGIKHYVSIPNGALVFNYGTDVDSPYQKYNGCLSVTLQNNMVVDDVSLLISNLARYGSNFTENVSGTCSIKNFTRPDGTLPHVGEHCTLQYLGVTHDYELQSFTVNTQTMTVDYVMGMKPINIGDVVYRITQNMTTNITTN